MAIQCPAPISQLSNESLNIRSESQRMWNWHAPWPKHYLFHRQIVAVRFFIATLSPPVYTTTCILCNMFWRKHNYSTEYVHWNRFFLSTVLVIRRWSGRLSIQIAGLWHFETSTSCMLFRLQERFGLGHGKITVLVKCWKSQHTLFQHLTRTTIFP